MKILVAPLNWGLGHASRCIPIVQQLLDKGNEVILGGDGESLVLLHKYFPQLQFIQLPSLQLQYSKGNSQVWAMLKAIPKIIRWSFQDHVTLKLLLMGNYFDQVISDNRFGLHHKDTYSIYITHQIMIKMPKSLKWLEPFGRWIHQQIIKKYDECWIPDFEKEPNLSGDLSHKYSLFKNSKYIGPLSRFSLNTETINSARENNYDIVAILSGLEPHRTLFEQEIINKYQNQEEKVLIVRGKPEQSMSITKHANLTFVPYLADDKLLPIMKAAKKIIARSGYSTIMDLYTLKMLDKAELIPTPGQTEQCYLAEHIKNFTPDTK